MITQTKRVYDEILIEQSRLNLTGIDDIDLITLSVDDVKTLLKEYKNEFDIEGNISVSDLSDLLGIKVMVTNESKSKFKLYKEVR